MEFIQPIAYQALYEQYLSKPVEGYLWLSDEPTPQWFQNEPAQKNLSEEGGFPYIREGILLTENGDSITIYHVDDGYRITLAELSNLKEQLDKKQFLLKPQSFVAHSHLFEKAKVTKLHFQQVFELKTNNLSNDFKEWQHLTRIFDRFQK